ncbi:SIR2 family protein [Luteibacter sp. 3190]|uniref:SIR2 family protein n=1 Tax=Luteibacter sp. 3190 TaxID=2817736 RepID=UPI0028644228|nr:SIR2 family protein [Luteibacter sp. 3190]MDR6937323.1 hypothetical protein [Luteibacter sp. 3190]
MRFIANGPAIPSELLTARDAGQVLFFCGAGVSRAAAGLPDFIDLAGQVLDKLGSARCSAARQLHLSAKAARDAGSGASGPGIDRVFSMLEREFDLADIRRVVTQTLTPAAPPDLSFHQALMDLSRTRSGAVRLVTTNFDSLFEACDPTLGVWVAPNLPDPKLPVDFRGIVHLHGRVGPAMPDGEADGGDPHGDQGALVLSTAEFGYSYLADGWATRFIQALMRRFTIVFVGYSADDPPVQYLLEAVRRFDGQQNPIYAFHAGDAEGGDAQWAQKGVTPIPYDDDNRHVALWDSLRAWADRARDPQAWAERVMARAMQGPAGVLPHERGMVRDLASSADGAHALAYAAEPIPASWLMVFDAVERRDKPLHPADTTPPAAAWKTYGLDDDPSPTATPDDSAPLPRLWDAFHLTAQDLRDGTANRRALVSQVDDHSAERVPPRIEYLRNWVARVSGDPVALWWAAGQRRVDSSLADQIMGRVTNAPEQYSVSLRWQWRMATQAWLQPPPLSDTRGFTIQRLAENGWTRELVHDTVDLFRPRFTVQRANRSVPEHLDSGAAPRIISLRMDYPEPHAIPSIPDEWLGEAIPRFRRLIEDGLILTRDIGLDVEGRVDDLINPDPHTHHLGLSKTLLVFCDWMRRWAASDRAAARVEQIRWQSSDERVFARLCVWALSIPDLTDIDQVAHALAVMDEKQFWDHAQENDLLSALVTRWPDMALADRAAAEERLLHGDPPFAREHPEAARLIAWTKLHRWHWLEHHGVVFTRDAADQLAELQRMAPEFTPAEVADGVLRRSGFFTQDIDSSHLESQSVQDIVSELSDDDDLDFRRLIQRRPFLGLVKHRPVTAIRALSAAMTRGVFNARAWRTLLSPEGNVTWPRRRASLVARRLTQLRTTDLAEITPDVANWMEERAGDLYQLDPGALDGLWTALFVAVPHARHTGWDTRPMRDWTMEAINSPIRGLLGVILNKDCGFPTRVGDPVPNRTLQRFDALLSLHGDLRRYAVCLMARQYSWLSAIAPKQTRRALLPHAFRKDDRDSFFQGLLSGHLRITPELFNELKPQLMDLIHEDNLPHDEQGVLVDLLMKGWLGVDVDGEDRQLLSDSELREALIVGGDRVRNTALWRLGNWANDEDSRWRPALARFFGTVWPLQRVVRTAQTTAALVKFALKMKGLFDEVVPLIVSHLVRLQDIGAYWYLDFTVDDLPKRHPVALLDILWAVLPTYTRDWPYGTEPLIRTLSEQPAAASDRRLVDLMRRLHQR